MKTSKQAVVYCALSVAMLGSAIIASNNAEATESTREEQREARTETGNRIIDTHWNFE